MSLFDQLQAALKQAMLGRKELERETLRMVIAGCKNRRIELGEDLSEDDVLGVLQKAVKSRQDSMTQYREAGRDDLADKEESEIAVLAGFLPQQLDEAATRELMQALIKELGLESKADMGKLMKALLAKHKGQVDGKLASRMAGELLG